jgi:homoserine/homoserine lactone efflux protein
MRTELLIAFFSSSSLIVFLPGPTVLLVVHYALQYGNWSGRYAIPATILGDIIAITLTFTGVETILTTFPEWLHIFKFIAGMYLIIIGIISIFSASTIQQKNLPQQKPSGRIIFTHIFLITAFNPKTIIFFLAFFPVFIDPAENTIRQMLTMGAIFISLGTISATTYCFAAAKINTLIQNGSTTRIINIITATILCIIGIVTILL